MAKKNGPVANTWRQSLPLATSPMPRAPLKTKIMRAKKRPFPVLSKPKR